MTLKHNTGEPLRSLGDVSVAQFLRDFWQQKPLLIRNAFASDGRFAPLTVKEIRTLAGYEEAESRLVMRTGREWTLAHGPFDAKVFRGLDRAHETGQAKWSVLVQDTQHFSHEAHQLLQKFSFLPYARIDDLMVSLANNGGGVGPHTDSYDVFLLQGNGSRRWQISSRTDFTLKPGMPLKILEGFKAEQEWILETGDMLYLPPGVAHHGIATTDDCVTWSVGFRSPTHQELLEHALNAIADSTDLPTRFGDAGRSRTAQPGRIDPSMQRDYGRALADIGRRALSTRQSWVHLGTWLTAPKSHVTFLPPRTMNPARFGTILGKPGAGLMLDLRSRHLFDAECHYLNGRIWSLRQALAASDDAALCTLANTRQLSLDQHGAPAQSLLTLLHDAWSRGELQFT